MKIHSATFLFLAIGFASAGTISSDKLLGLSKETHLQIKNSASADIVDTIVTVNNVKDFEKGSGPHVNFQGVQIHAGESVDRREEVARLKKSAYFTMTLKFDDDSQDVFKANLRSAVGSGSPDLQIISGNRKYQPQPQAGPNRNTLLITVLDK